MLTDVDLFPKEGWSFGNNNRINAIVFGTTNVASRICIISIARHNPNFANETDEPFNENLITYRALKVLYIYSLSCRQ